MAIRVRPVIGEKTTPRRFLWLQGVGPYSGWQTEGRDELWGFLSGRPKPREGSYAKTTHMRGLLGRRGPFAGRVQSLPKRGDDVEVTSLLGVEEVLWARVLGLWSRGHSTRLLFDSAVRAKGELKQALVDALAKHGDAGEIVRTAIEEYRSKGDERRMSLAVTLVDHMGSRSLRALKELADSGMPEGAYFTSVVLHLSDVDDTTKLNVLEEFAKSRASDVRRSVLEALETHGAKGAKEILTLLRSDVDPSIANGAALVLRESSG